MNGLARDLDAAVTVAVRVNEMAVLSKTDFDGGVRIYELVTIRDEPATLRVEGLIAGNDRLTPRDLTLTANVGRFGDAGRENRLVNDVRARLAELAGDPYSLKPHPVKEEVR